MYFLRWRCQEGAIKGDGQQTIQVRYSEIMRHHVLVLQYMRLASSSQIGRKSPPMLSTVDNHGENSTEWKEWKFLFFSRFQQDIGELFQMFQAREEAERTDGTHSFSEHQDPRIVCPRAALLTALFVDWRGRGDTDSIESVGTSSEDPCDASCDRSVRSFRLGVTVSSYPQVVPVTRSWRREQQLIFPLSWWVSEF